jgi:Cell division protein FtsI/penicillin-binding protein 2
MIDLNRTVSEKKNFFNRLIIIYTFFGLLFLYFLYKTFSLQVSSYTDYEIAALENKTREILVQPRRGIIFDRNGKILVNNVPSYNLIISPSQIDDLDSLLDQIQPIVSLSDEDIDYVNKNYQSRAKLNRELIIKRNLTIEEIAKLK